MFYYCILGTSTGVAFDQIPQASLEEIMDGGTFVTPTYDEIALCSAAFRVLRSMVNVWFRDVVLHKNVYADFQMVHFYRYFFLKIFNYNIPHLPLVCVYIRPEF